MSVVTVVGSGMMGSAIAIPAAENGHEVRLVGSPLDDEIISHAKETGDHLTLKRKLPSSFQYFPVSELELALEGANVVVSGVSSFGVEWFAHHVLPKIPELLPILAVTKGMHLTEDKTLITFPEYYQELFPKKQLSLNCVGGPCTSYELADHDQTEVAFCGTDPIVLAGLRGIFETDYYHVSTTTDVRGLEVAVAMKNAYALAVCLAVGMSKVRNKDGHPNYNSQAALFGQSIREMRKLLDIYGGEPDKIVYGAGDLYVTIFGGRTRMVGTLLGEGDTLSQALDKLQGVTLESIVIATRTALAVQELIARGKANAQDFPLMLHVDDIINKNQKVAIPWNAFETIAQ